MQWLQELRKSKAAVTDDGDEQRNTHPQQTIIQQGICQRDQVRVTFCRTPVLCHQLERLCPGWLQQGRQHLVIDIPGDGVTRQLQNHQNNGHDVGSHRCPQIGRQRKKDNPEEEDIRQREHQERLDIVDKEERPHHGLAHAEKRAKPKTDQLTAEDKDRQCHPSQKTTEEIPRLADRLREEQRMNVILIVLLDDRGHRRDQQHVDHQSENAAAGAQQDAGDGRGRIHGRQTVRPGGGKHPSRRHSEQQGQDEQDGKINVGIRSAQSAPDLESVYLTKHGGCYFWVMVEK